MNRAIGKIWRRSEAGEKGFALLAVLVILAILTPLVVNFSYSARVQMAGADYFSSKIKSHEVARAGLESAIQALKRDNNKYDAFNEDWGRFGELSQFSGSFFDEGSFVGRIDDEEGKLNINDLVYSGTQNIVMVEQMERFFELKNINIDLIDGVIDWLDEDSETELMGAETDYYNTLDNPYNAKNGKMASLHELRLIKGVNEGLSKKGEDAALEPYLSVYGDGKVNINTAPAEVLLSLADEMDEAAVEAIISYREENPFLSPDDLKKVPGLDEETRKAIASKVKVTSAYFSVKVRGTVKEVSTDIYTVVRRDNGKIKIIYYGEV